MSTKMDNITNDLTLLGLTQDEATVYLTLLQNDALSPLELSRVTKIGRSKVYRLLERLHDAGLSQSQIINGKLRFRAQPYQYLEGLIRQQEVKTSELKRALPSMFGDIANLLSNDGLGSRIHYYSGPEGLKQVTLNSLEAKNELLIFEIKDLGAFLDFGFAEEVRRDFVQHDVRVREISSEPEVTPWTKVTEFATKHWNCRYIDPGDLEIEVEVLIYNHTVAMYNYHQGEIFCIEIQSRAIANMQRQLFNFVWNKATPMRKIGNEGAAKLA